MRHRPSSRLIVLSRQKRVLLFNFSHKHDALSGRSYWATPGGGLEENESYEQAALRELLEETGLERHSAGPHVASRSFPMKLPNGETVIAEERFFTVHADNEGIDCSGWSSSEKQVIRRYQWWTAEDIRRSRETIFPRDVILEIMEAC